MKRAVIAIIGAAGIAATGAGCGTAAATHHSASTTHPPATNSQNNNNQSNNNQSNNAQPSSPAPSPAPQTVTFETSGSAPSGVISPTITYGAEGSSSSGQVPMDLTQNIPSSAPDYYSLTIQLSDAGGNASCEILIDGKVISTANTSGADNIAMCEVSQNPLTGGWENTNNG